MAESWAAEKLWEQGKYGSLAWQEMDRAQSSFWDLCKAIVPKGEG